MSAPVNAPLSLPEGAQLQASRQPDEKANILIVDDLAEKLLVFGTVLEELNQNLVFARSGKEALREVLQREFAVILLDVNMPDIDGFETASLIRQYKRSTHTPIIFITSYADEMQTARGYSLGAVDYILSPVVPHVLRSKVQVFVQLFEMQRQIRRQADAHAAFVVAETARRSAEESDRRSAFVSNASRVLHRSLHFEVCKRSLAELVITRLASVAIVVNVSDDSPASALVAARGASGAVVYRDLLLSDLGETLSEMLCAVMRQKARLDLAAESLSAFDLLSLGVPVDAHLPDRLEAMAVVPLLIGDRVLGALVAANGAVAEAGLQIPWSVLDDLAARAAAAFENARLYGSLQNEINERRAAEDKLQDASRRKDEFLAMLSHELRNPLAPIRTALELVRRVAPPIPKLHWASDIMERQLRQMTRLIEELLDVARISQGKIVLTRAKVDLNSVIAQSVETAQPLVDSRSQTLRVTAFAESMWLQGDFARLSQIISNLLHNASKYSDKGSLIELSATLDELGAVIRVRDEGIGIDPQLLPRIFDLFIQGERGLDRAQGGLGVGLTLAQRLAELHGGRIDASSDGPGQGCVFTLRLPCVGLVQASEPTISSVVSPPSASALRILVVDDNRDAAESVAKFLEFGGHTVRTAADGKLAIDVAAAFAPDVAVIDIGLPLLDGYEVARRLRLLDSLAGTLLVALTGYGQQEDKLNAEAAGFDRHFVKPAEPSELLLCIDAWAANGRSDTARVNRTEGGQGG